MLDLLLTAAAAMEERLNVVLLPHALSVAEWRVLDALYAAGPQPPSALAERLHLTRGGVTRLADRLRARRLLVRAAAGRADRRYQTLALTGGGAMLVASLQTSVAELEEDWSRSLPVTDRTKLVALLQLVA